MKGGKRNEKSISVIISIILNYYVDFLKIINIYILFFQNGVKKIKVSK